MKRAYTFYVTTAANANMQQFTVTSIDDYRVRHLNRIYCGLTVSGVSLAVYSTGQQYLLVDTTRFGNGNWPVEIDVDVPAKIQLVVGVQDLSGAARTNVPIVIEYDVDQGTGP